jgi:hypothetical protein
MSLIVEDGTGLSTAESFISVADADTRHTNMGNTNWAALTTEEKEQALRRGTQYMEQAYRTRWLGTRTHEDQALSWPRVIMQAVDGWWIDSDEVPSIVANACADMALKAAAGDLNADLTRGVVREKVGPLETEYDRASPQSTRYRAVDMMLAHLLSGGSANARLVRA